MSNDEGLALDDEVFDPSEQEDAELARPVSYIISSYGADYPVDGLVKRIERGDVYVPDFQRGFVWSHAQASRFIESLLLGLPVPGIFLFKEPETGKLVVVDGQQRLRTLQAFYIGLIRGREFRLRGVSQNFEERTYSTLEEQDRRRLDDSILHATIFQQESPQQDRSSVYLIFERLNTGGTPLSPQEIRSCVSRGEFNTLLQELANEPNWRNVYGPASPRAKDQELILRFFALYYKANEYERPMKSFLDKFMDQNRAPTVERVREMTALFQGATALAKDALGRRAFRPERSFNAAAAEALLIGLAHRLGRGPVTQYSQLEAALAQLYENAEFTAAISSSTTNTDQVSRRLNAARLAFADVP